MKKEVYGLMFFYIALAWITRVSPRLRAFRLDYAGT